MQANPENSEGVKRKASRQGVSPNLLAGAIHQSSRRAGRAVRPAIDNTK